MDLFNQLIFVNLFIMKKLLIILLLFPLLSFSQNEIGKTRSQIIATARLELGEKGLN